MAKPLSPKSQMMERMKRDPPSPISHLGLYLADLASKGQEHAEVADTLTADLIEAFTSEPGLRVLILLEKSVLFAGLPNGASDGALRELNAQRNLVLEIRRIVANG